MAPRDQGRLIPSRPAGSSQREGSPVGIAARRCRGHDPPIPSSRPQQHVAVPCGIAKKKECTVSDSDCLFCRIASGEIPADLVRSDPDAVAFRDINPQAPTHILIIPRKHIPSVADLNDGDSDVMGTLFLMARDLAREEGLTENGYRMVVNAGADAGQTVFHIHLHLLGGRGMGWPPG
ncbi:MAG: histidine triad nucleotide-binding protein [Gemmatimonadetes bacterium]|nr:histidine triad nucleotide-binding protein [Gemmatimonadota bacterium]NNM06474.1 histidine triad nucleotide-binding protein [Gemmatimonadota bacterium]